MNTRDQRTLVIVLLGVFLTLAVAFAGWTLFWEPLRQREGSIFVMQQEIDKKRQEIQKVQAERVRLDRWKQMSLPADVDLASREYERFLSDLLRQSQFAAGAFTIEAKKAGKSTATLPHKKDPIYTKLGFTVTTRGDLTTLLTFLEKFYRTGLLHQITDLSVQRPRTAAANQKPTDLDINLGIEALVLAEAENRPYLVPVDPRIVVTDVVATLRHGPGGLALAAAQAGPAGALGGRHLAAGRQYASILGKNIFFGPPAPLPVVKETPRVEDKRDRTDVTPFVHLTDITLGPTKAEAFLWDRYNSKRTRLQVSAGFDTFRIRNGAGETVVSGKVVKIADRDVIFVANEKYYAIHVGASLKEALAHPLKDAQLKEFDLTPLTVDKTKQEPGAEELKTPPKELTDKPEPGVERDADN